MENCLGEGDQRFENEAMINQVQLKRDFNRREFEQLLEENAILRENIEINKSIISQLLRNGATSMLNR